MPYNVPIKQSLRLNHKVKPKRMLYANQVTQKGWKYENSKANQACENKIAGGLTPNLSKGWFQEESIKLHKGRQLVMIKDAIHNESSPKNDHI